MEFIVELEESGYVLVDAFHQERIDAKDPCKKRTYHMVRFSFVRHEFAAISDDFKKIQDSIRAELRMICKNVMWRVRSFSNPLYEDGKEVSGHRAVSVNLEVRKPLLLPNDQPVKVWQKDENGKRIGKAPLPIKPDHSLRVVKGAVELVPA